MMKRPQTPTQITSDRDRSRNMMVALSGWPEPVYVSNVDASQRKDKESASATAKAVRILPHLDSGVVRDGFNLNPTPHHHFTPSSTTTTNTNTTTVSPIITTPNRPVPVAVSVEDKKQVIGNENTSVVSPTTKLVSPISILANKVTTSPKNISPISRIPNSSTATIGIVQDDNNTPMAMPIAPPTSIFATTCRHLLDPSLGPCPFPTHPHDIKALYPPTSHLPPGSKLKGKGKYRSHNHNKRSSASSSSSSSSANHVVKKDDEQHEYDNGDDDIDIDIKMGDEKVQVQVSSTKSMPPPPFPLPPHSHSRSRSRSNSNSQSCSPSLNSAPTPTRSPLTSPNLQGKSTFSKKHLIDPTLISEEGPTTNKGKGKSLSSSSINNADIDMKVNVSGSGTPSRNQTKLSISDMLH